MANANPSGALSNPQVVFRFKEIFLFGIRPDCLTVLAPAKGHQAFFEGPRIGRLTLTNHVISIFKDGQRATGTLQRHTELYMVDMDEVLGKGTYDVNLDPGPSLARGRFELGGELCALERLPMEPLPGDEEYVELEWAFGAHYNHRMTNRAEFLLYAPTDLDRYTLRVEDRNTGSIKSYPMQDGDVYVAEMRETNPPPPHRRRTIREFALLYELLLDEDGETMMGPIPTDPRPEPLEERRRRLASPPAAPRRDAPRCIEPVCPNACCSLPQAQRGGAS